MNRCRSGQCVLARSFVFNVVAAGSTCAHENAVWWRHQYVSGDSGPNDRTLNSDAATGNPEVCAAYAMTDSRCAGGHLMFSPAYSWEWGFFCCEAGSTFTANNANWNILSYAPLNPPPPPPPPPPMPSPPEPSPPPPPPPLPPDMILLSDGEMALRNGVASSGSCGGGCMVLAGFVGAVIMLIVMLTIGFFWRRRRSVGRPPPLLTANFGTTHSLSVVSSPLGVEPIGVVPTSTTKNTAAIDRARSAAAPDAAASPYSKMVDDAMNTTKI